MLTGFIVEGTLIILTLHANDREAWNADQAFGTAKARVGALAPGLDARNEQRHVR